MSGDAVPEGVVIVRFRRDRRQCPLPGNVNTPIAARQSQGVLTPVVFREPRADRPSEADRAGDSPALTNSPALTRGPGLTDGPALTDNPAQAEATHSR